VVCHSKQVPCSLLEKKCYIWVNVIIAGDFCNAAISIMLIFEWNDRLQLFSCSSTQDSAGGWPWGRQGSFVVKFAANDGSWAGKCLIDEKSMLNFSDKNGMVYAMKLIVASVQ